MKHVLITLSVVLLVVTSAVACDPQLDLGTVELDSHGIWRGIELGSGTYVRVRSDFALCGPRSAEPGPHGLEVSIDAALPLAGDGEKLGSASLRYLYFFGEGNASWLAAGYREYRWEAGDNRWSGEVFIEATRKLVIQEQGLTFQPYAEIAHDFQRFDATYARAGVHHIVGYRRIAADLDTSVSGSDYSDSFGFHAVEATLWTDWTIAEGGTIDVGVGGGRVWVADEIGRDRGWIGLRVRIR